MFCTLANNSVLIVVTEIFWTGFRGIVDRFANCYEITGRVLSYCHPVEKIGQVYAIVFKKC